MSTDARNRRSQYSEEIQRKVEELASLLSREKYGPDGPPLELTFSEIEMLGHELGRFTAVAFDEHVQSQHSTHFVDAQTCPQCGKSCKVKSSDRTIQTLDGDLSTTEPCCYCNACERSFFPSAGAS